MARRSLINPEHLDELEETARDCSAPGCFVEVGVYQGGSAARLQAVADEQHRELWLFDTFTGMPEASAGDAHKVGDFADTSVAEVRAAFPRARVIQGDARELLPEIQTGPVAFAHVDCDQHATTLIVSRALSERMAPGGCIVFDDPSSIHNAWRAVHAVFGERLELSPLGKYRVRF